MMAELLKQAAKSNGPVPVRGRLHGAAFQQTVVKFRRKWRLYLNGELRARAGVDSGDMVEVQLALDPKPPVTPMPAKLAVALAKDVKAGAAFEALTPSRRKDIIAYLSNLKTEEALARNIKKVLQQLKP